MEKMNTCTIILPIDRKKSWQLLTMLEMFSKAAVIPLREITSVIPKSTFFALMYRLKLLNRLVSELHGFELFSFEKLLDFGSMKELKADFSLLKDMKVMKLNASVNVRELDGSQFVVFRKEL
ncbi:hypothetical protein HYU17_04080 [Candidatus Woesearchaeota archaeon]|nr:hypothetical protein [Candidatus Woesearchaeota archaeon]